MPRLYPILAALACLVPVSGPAQSPIPEISGIWNRLGCVEDPVTCPMSLEALPLRARTIGFRAAFDEVLAPKYDCVQATVPSLVNDPYNFAIEQRDDRVVMRYEKDDVIRTVWLEGHGHPEPGVYDFYPHGHSVGRYENGELVVETTRFSFDPIGLDDMLNIPSSTQKRVIERYRLAAGRLVASVTTYDPLILLEPIEMRLEWTPTDTPLLPYNCDPELAKLQLDLLPPKYQDPGWVRLPDSQ